jgi:hypothetical protein
MFPRKISNRKEKYTITTLSLVQPSQKRLTHICTFGVHVCHIILYIYIYIYIYSSFHGIKAAGVLNSPLTSN